MVPEALATDVNELAALLTLDALLVRFFECKSDQPAVTRASVAEGLRTSLALALAFAALAAAALALALALLALLALLDMLILSPGLRPIVGGRTRVEAMGVTLTLMLL